jgi:hypothetical protein
MKHSDFKIGEDFYVDWCARYRCTDIGTRTIVAIRVDRVVIWKSGKEDVLSFEEATADGWFEGPPYAVAEYVFDEDGMKTAKRLEPSQDAADRGNEDADNT